jgi:hypothetical protein
MGTVYRMASDSADGISVNSGNKTGGFRGFSAISAQIKAFESVWQHY